jgi:hypothetical protein
LARIELKKVQNVIDVYKGETLKRAILTIAQMMEHILSLEGLLYN